MNIDMQIKHTNQYIVHVAVHNAVLIRTYVQLFVLYYILTRTHILGWRRCCSN